MAAPRPTRPPRSGSVLSPEPAQPTLPPAGPLSSSDQKFSMILNEKNLRKALQDNNSFIIQVRDKNDILKSMSITNYEGETDNGFKYKIFVEEQTDDKSICTNYYKDIDAFIKVFVNREKADKYEWYNICKLGKGEIIATKGEETNLTGTSRKKRSQRLVKKHRTRRHSKKY